MSALYTQAFFCKVFLAFYSETLILFRVTFFMEKILLGIVGAILLAYVLGYFFFRSRIFRVEKKIIHTFLLKVSKIPALIEVMRPYVVDEKAFDSVTELHSDAMTRRFDSIYALLEHNARIHREFLFLMKLAVQIDDLQKNAQFLYIRDFIIDYERNMKKDFDLYNQAVEQWNTFVNIKNLTLVGILFPGSKREFI